MKRWISRALTFILICSCTQGGLTAARAEDEEVLSMQVEAPVAFSTEVDAEGMEIEPDALDFAFDADVEAVCAEEDAIAGDEAEAAAPAPLYARIAGQTGVCEAPGGESVAVVEAAGGVLVLDAAEWTKVAFNTERGIVTGYVAADRLSPLDDAEIAAFLDALAESGDVTLYNDDLDRPLATLKCAFPGEEADVNAAPSEETETEPGEASEDESGTEVSEAPDEAIETEPSAEPSQINEAEPVDAAESAEVTESADTQSAEEPAAEPVVEPSAEPVEEAEADAEPSAETSAEPSAVPSVEPSAEPSAETSAEPSVQPSVTPSAAPTPSATPGVVVLSADELGTLDKMFAAAGFAIESTANSLKVGDSCTVKAINGNGIAINPKELTFRSSDTAVAKVSDTGVVTACAPGTASISVTYYKSTLSTSIKVLPFPAGIELPAKLVLGLKETGARLTPVMVPPAGQTACSSVTVTWTSSNKKVVAIDAKTGIMKAKKKGSATITATSSNGKKAKCKVYVRKAPKKITLSPASVKLSAGGMKFRLTVKLPKNTGSTLSFTSSNPNVAAVAADGTITTVAKGSAVITASTFNGKTAKCAVTVTGVPVTASFANTTINLPTGSALAPRMSIKAADGSEAVANLSYTVTSGAGCIKVDAESGIITGVKTGTAVITGTTHNGVRTGNRCTINVVAAPSKVKLNQTKLSMGKGQQYTLIPDIAADLGCDLSLTWKSSKPKVAAVDAFGVVTAKTTGSAIISIKTYNGKTAKCKVTVKKAPKKVTLKPSSGSINVGATAKFTVKLPGGSAGSYTFTSSNPAVATVSNNGTVTGVSAGTTTITVTTYNGRTAKATLTVKATTGDTSVPESLEKLGLASYQSTYYSGMSKEQKIEYVIYNAQNQLGKPYIYGSGYQTANPKGFDCSGLVYWCYYKIGVKLGNSAYKQGYDNNYTKIGSIDDLKRGDVVCFNTSNDSDLSDHTGIYLGKGYFIHASSGSSKRKVVVQRFTNDSISSDWYKRHFSWGRRIL